MSPTREILVIEIVILVLAAVSFGLWTAHWLRWIP
jgi:F0F1-type ATP synthase assembly protein I